MPCCLWDKDFLALMIKDKTIAKPCQLICGTGLLFDTNGELIPCNAMYPIKLGKLGVNFDDFSSLKKYLSSEKMVNSYSVLRGVPDPKCLKCLLKDFCGGGCSNFWTNFTMEDLENFKIDFDKMKSQKIK